MTMVQGEHLRRAVEPDDHAQGPATAAVTLVQYGDYQCPHSAKAVDIVKKVRLKFGDRLRFVYRHFPLILKHPRAQPAAEAAEAAAAQGRFWEMHGLLYVGQARLGDEDLRDYARQLYLDMVRFDAALAQHTYANRVKRDALSGEQSGVRGTPTYFINAIRYEGPDDLSGLVDAIDAALHHKGKNGR